MSPELRIITILGSLYNPQNQEAFLVVRPPLSSSIWLGISTETNDSVERLGDSTDQDLSVESVESAFYFFRIGIVRP
jgi:hypothetical protein